LHVGSLQLLVVDEADLVLCYGHGEDLRVLLSELPRTGRQTALVSATLNADLAELRTLALKRPAILKLEEPEV
jgi:ATP-dependent RNA helicase DDX56/DBP9